MWEETEREGEYRQLYRGGGEDELGPRVFTHGEGLISCPGERLEVGGVGRGWSGLVSDRERNGSADVNPRGETKREEAVGFAQDASGDVSEGCCSRASFRVGDWGEARSKETSLCRREEQRPLLNGRGSRARNLLG